MYKRYEEEQWRIEHADNATITFTIALHGPHAWEMRMEDSDRYHSISHGWAIESPHAWENTIVPRLRQFFNRSTRPSGPNNTNRWSFGLLMLTATMAASEPDVTPYQLQANCEKRPRKRRWMIETDSTTERINGFHRSTNIGLFNCSLKTSNATQTETRPVKPYMKDPICLLSSAAVQVIR